MRAFAAAALSARRAAGHGGGRARRRARRAGREPLVAGGPPDRARPRCSSDGGARLPRCRRPARRGAPDPDAGPRRGGRARGGVRDLRHRPADRLGRRTARIPRGRSACPATRSPARSPRRRRRRHRGGHAACSSRRTSAAGVCRQCRHGRVNLCRTPSALGITLDGGFSTHVLVPAAAVRQGNVMALRSGRRRGGGVGGRAAGLRAARPARSAASGASDVVLIVGAGPIGLLHLLAAARARARRDRRLRAVARPPRPGGGVGRRPHRRPVGGGPAPRSSATDGADVVIVAAPAAEAQAEALELAATGGRINFFGGLPSGSSRGRARHQPHPLQGAVVTGTTANTTDDCRAALELVTGGAVDAGPAGHRPAATGRGGRRRSTPPARGRRSRS